MAQKVGSSYDEVPYESNPFGQTHPAAVAAVATLFGMKPPAVTQCRVLELGCASGGNLIPMATQLAASHFVGIDLSARQIADGQKIVDALSLKNITLKQLSILDVDASLGQFDYIIAHGIYSWVPGPVQDKILAICSENLAPNGVAYVSYNTYPGWHMRGMIRDMMCYHAGHFPEPLVRAQQARALLDFLAQSIKSEKNPYGIMLQQELEMLRKQPDSYLLHDHLEEVNDPIYFYQFQERASAKGLQYLGEAELSSMMTTHFGTEVEKTLKSVARSLEQTEQYIDFLRNRTFRQTLLCHQGIPLSRTLMPESVLNFFVCSPAKAVSATPDLVSNNMEQFKGPTGSVLNTFLPLHKMAMVYLGEIWPEAVPFTKLFETASQRIGFKPAPIMGPDGMNGEAKTLAMSLLQGYTVQIIQFYTYAAPFVRDISERPVASPLAQLQAHSSSKVTNLRHALVQLSDYNVQLVRLLDGTRDRAALVEELASLITKGVLRMNRGNQPITDPTEIRSILTPAIDQSIHNLVLNCLMVG